MSRRCRTTSTGYVPTPALVFPIEFTLRLSDYAEMGGHMDRVVTLADVQRTGGRRSAVAGGRANDGVCRAAAGSTGCTCQHGPIDLVIGADGAPAEIEARLRRGGRSVSAASCRHWSANCHVAHAVAAPRRRSRPRHGPVARRMHRSRLALSRPLHHADGGGCRQRRADHVLAAMLRGRTDLRRAYVNNGGDIALASGAG